MMVRTIKYQISSKAVEALLKGRLRRVINRFPKKMSGVLLLKIESIQGDLPVDLQKLIHLFYSTYLCQTMTSSLNLKVYNVNNLNYCS